MYKKPIILFGIVTPMVFSLILLGICSQLKRKVSVVYDVRAQQYKSFQVSKLTSAQIEQEVKSQRDLYNQWQALLEQDSLSVLNENMKILAGKLPSKEFQQPIPEKLSNKLGFGQASAQKSNAIKFNLKGTYRTTQKALLELETRMPNLQLQDLRIDPNPNSNSSLLSVQVTYTAWEK
jgi:hypothetical protein